MLINQARNLTSLPTSTLGEIRQSMDRMRQLIGEAQRLAYNVRDLDRVFAQRYPAGSLAGTSHGRLVENADERWLVAVASSQTPLKTQATIHPNSGTTPPKIQP